MASIEIKENPSKFPSANCILESQTLSFRLEDLHVNQPLTGILKMLKETAVRFGSLGNVFLPCLWGLAVITPHSYQQIPSPCIFLRFPAVSPIVETVVQAEEYGHVFSAEHAYSLSKMEQFFLFFCVPDPMHSRQTISPICWPATAFLKEHNFKSQICIMGED